MKSKISLLTITAVTLASPLAILPAHAVPIAIVDSGTDLNHPELKNVQWTNAKEDDDGVDNDDNGYIDDLHGWNFAENNNKLFDKRLLGTFSKDTYKFFELQTKMLNGVATADEIKWMKALVADPKKLGELQLFGNFVHGTHVAGISSKESPLAQIMPLKLIPTKTPKLASMLTRNGMLPTMSSARGDAMKKKLLMLAIDFIASKQGDVFGPISKYMKLEGARVANCSFGTGFVQARMIMGMLTKLVFKRDLPQAEVDEYATHFVNAVLKAADKSFIKGAPDTLFVMAAGNDGMSNDLYPSSPSNIRAPNTITVAATNGYAKIASFSNFGEKMVDVAAPGVGIHSTIPGGEYLLLSGTSQAAPFVTNVAGQILDANPKLKPIEVRQILMGTTDVKDFLKGKVASSGIVNGRRAVTAARYSLTIGVEAAIARSRNEVADRPGEKGASDLGGTFVAPLPGLFY